MSTLWRCDAPECESEAFIEADPADPWPPPKDALAGWLVLKPESGTPTYHACSWWCLAKLAAVMDKEGPR